MPIGFPVGDVVTGSRVVCPCFNNPKLPLHLYYYFFFFFFFGGRITTKHFSMNHSTS